MAEKSLILVEGLADKSFFDELCKQLTPKPNVEIAPPKELGGKSNTKQGVFNHLPKLLKQLSDGELQRLALVVDADHSEINTPDGYRNTLDKITAIIEPFGFSLANSLNGLIFEHNDGLENLGVWIMPNNQDEGILEDLIKTCIKEKSLLEIAQEKISELPKQFKINRLAKAEVYTYLAWQDKPENGVHYVLENNLLDEQHPQFQALSNWLTAIFPSQESVL